MRTTSGTPGRRGRRRLRVGGNKPQEIVYERRYGLWDDRAAEWQYFNTPAEVGEEITKRLPNLSRNRTLAVKWEDFEK